jgi:phage FluMu gp28-like protein
MLMSQTELEFLKQLQQLLNPSAWLERFTGWRAWGYETEILNDNSLRLRVIRKARQIGITTTIGYEVIWKAYTSAKRVILIVSPSERQSKIVMTRIQAVIDSNEALYKRVQRKNTSQVDLDNGSTIMSLPNNPDRLRGFSATDIYLDEAAHFLNDAPVMAAIKPMLIATHGTFTVISTPFGKRGIFWEQYKQATDQAGLTEDVKAYNLFPSTISPLIHEEDLERERLNLTDLEYAQEYQGEFIEEVDVYIPMALIEPCVDANMTLLDHGEEGHKYYSGTDFAKQRDETVICLLDKQVDENERNRFDLRHISAWSHMDYSDQIGRIGQLTQKFDMRGMPGAADQTGVGEAVIEDLTRILPNVEGVVFTMPKKTELAAGLRVLFEQKAIRIPNDRKLIMQLNSLRYKVSKTGNILFESPEKEKLHDDYLWALALACYAARQPEAVIQDLF